MHYTWFNLKASRNVHCPHVPLHRQICLQSFLLQQYVISHSPQQLLCAHMSCRSKKNLVVLQFKTTKKMVHAREIQLLHSRQDVGLNCNSSEHRLNRTSNQKVRRESHFVHLTHDYSRNGHLQSFHFDLCIGFAWQGFSCRRATKERAAVTTQDELITAHLPVLLWRERIQERKEKGRSGATGLLD